MCGRYVSVRSDGDVLAEFDAVDATGGDTAPADYNVAPTKPVRVIVNRPLRDARGVPAAGATRQLRVVSWGLVPSWAKDRTIASKLINARVESVTSKPAFRRAYAKRRCLVPADGWYEWRLRDTAEGPRKQPMYMTPSDAHGLAFAGLYEFWGPPGQTLTTCTIITAAAQGALAEIHDRMPLVLASHAWTRWLDPSVTGPDDLLAPWDEVAGEHLELRPVASTVNSVENNGAELIERVEPAPAAQLLF
jgi:putative SOS response-associated peptidase YedK